MVKGDIIGNKPFAPLGLNFVFLGYAGAYESEFIRDVHGLSGIYSRAHHGALHRNKLGKKFRNISLDIAYDRRTGL